jgi:uncharacterized protein (DUF58 family)
MPEAPLKLEDLQQYDNLELLARQVVEGFIVGLHKSPLHGFSVEFAEHHPYNPGEDIKNIDWKVFARTDRLYVKRYEEETNLRCQVVVDSSSSMFFPSQDRNKLQFSIYGAAALMHILKKQRDAFGLTTFSDKIESHTRNKSTTVHYRYILGELEKLLKNPPENKATSTAKCLHQLAESLHKRSLVIIFSDMFENLATAEEEDNLDQQRQTQMEELFSALQHLRHNKHEVILFHVTDEEKEINFAFENRPYQFIDMETGEKVKVQANQVKEFYTKKMREFKQQLKLRCGQYEIDFIEADINKDYHQILLPYLVKRQRMQ